MVSATVGIVNAIQASRAQPVSVRCLQKAVLPPTTLYAMEEGNASVTAVSVTRVTSIHDARHALAALTLARPNCKEAKFIFNFYFKVIIEGLIHHITKKDIKVFGHETTK